MGPARPKGFQPGGGALVPYQQRQDEPSDHREVPQGIHRAMVWSIAGGLCMALSAPLGCLFVGYGVSLAYEGASSKKDGLTACLTAVAATCASGWFGGWVRVAEGLAACIVAICATALTSRGKTTPSVGCLFIATASVLLMGADALVAWSQQTTISEVIQQVARQYAELMSAGSSTLSQKEALDGLYEGLNTYWPLSYAFMAAVEGFLAYLGARAGMRVARKGLLAHARLSRFRAPIWVAALFIVAAALRLASTRGLALPDAAMIADANILALSRVALALGGLAVADWFLIHRGFGPFGRFCAMVVGIWLETSFTVMTVVGLVDLLADFRGMRDEAGKAPQPGSDSKESA